MAITGRRGTSVCRSISRPARDRRGVAEWLSRQLNCVSINIWLFSIVDVKMADLAIQQLTMAYEIVRQYAKRGLHPEEFLTYDFLHKHPILLQPGMLRLDWNQIPGLTRRIATLPTVVVPDSLWDRWLMDWKDTWEPDEDPGHFIRNVALVVCRSRFNDNPDIKGRNKRVYSLAIAQVPDVIKLATLTEANVLMEQTEVNLNSVICLTRLHKAAKFYPDYFCNWKKRQITLQHMEEWTAAAGAAANFAGAKLLTAHTTSSREETYSKLPPGYRKGCTRDLINTGGRRYKVWESGRDKRWLDIYDLPLSAVTMMLWMPEHGDFPRVIVDMEPFRKWPENRWPKEVAWIIPAREDPHKQTSSTGSPAPRDSSDDSDRDSRRNSPASSWASSPAHSVGSAASSVAGDLLLSSSSWSGSGSDTPSLSRDPSDDDGGRASDNDSAGPSGGEEGRSDNENNPGAGPERQPDNRGDASGRESDDSSSDSDDKSSDNGKGTSEVLQKGTSAQHLEAVYSRILQALHKTVKIMCTRYVKAAGDIQPIIHAAVQEAVRSNKVYIQSTTGHLSEWGQALHDMLNSDGASAEERERASRAARLAGLKCVRSLLADGQAFNEAEEHDMEKRLHDTVQAALKVANKRANKTLEKVNKRVPKIIRRYVPNSQAGTFIASVHRSMGEHYLLVHGMVMSQVVVPFHVTRGTYFTSGNMFRAINNVVPGLSAATTGYQAAPPVLLALPATENQDAPSQIRVPKESQETPLKDTPTGTPSKSGHVETGTPGGGRTSSKRSSGKAPLMELSRRNFKAKEEKIQTVGTPGSKRSGSGKKLDSGEIAKTWVGFEREDEARDTARQVLEMNPSSGSAPLSVSDHEELSVEILMERDAPNREGVSGQVARKHKGDSSTDDDAERPAAESSRCKKRKKQQPDDVDMFDSDYKGKLSFSKPSPVKPVSSSRSQPGSGKTSKHRDDDSGLGSSLSEPKKSKKSKKSKGSSDPDPLEDELQKRKEWQERVDCDQCGTQALLVEQRPLQYALEVETMKNYRSQHVSPRQAACENTDDHSAYIGYILRNNKQSYICQSFHLFSVDAYFRRVKYKMGQATGKEKARLQEVYNSSQTTLAKKLAGLKGRVSDNSLARYLIRVLKSSDGDILDASHLEFGSKQNLGLHGLVSAIATASVTRNKKRMFHDGWGDCHIEHGFCPLCSYSSGGHQALSNHIRAHLRLAMFCGWCYCKHRRHAQTWACARNHPYRAFGAGEEEVNFGRRIPGTASFRRPKTRRTQFFFFINLVTLLAG